MPANHCVRSGAISLAQRPLIASHLPLCALRRRPKSPRKIVTAPICLARRKRWYARRNDKRLLLFRFCLRRDEKNGEFFCKQAPRPLSLFLRCVVPTVNQFVRVRSSHMTMDRKLAESVRVRALSVIRPSDLSAS